MSDYKEVIIVKEKCDKWDMIQSLDLSSVKSKLRVRKGWWWCFRNNPDKIEQEYRKFLYVIAKNPDDKVAPWSKALDEFWHEHILDTRKYKRDCERLFERYIEHDPHLPVGTSAHTAALNRSKTTRKEYFDDGGGAASSWSIADLMPDCGSDSSCGGDSGCSSCSSCGGCGD